MAAPQHIQQPIEADVDDDADSAIGVRSLASSTTSIGSSILKGRQENGRTYHAYKDGKYVLPEDETEQDRLDRWCYFALHVLFMNTNVFP